VSRRAGGVSGGGAVLGGTAARQGHGNEGGGHQAGQDLFGFHLTLSYNITFVNSNLCQAGYPAATANSALDGAGEHNLDELLLAGNEDDHAGNDNRNHTHHHQGDRLGVGVVQHADADLDGAHLLGAGDQQRPHVHVPGVDEGVHRHGTDGGLGQGQQDADDEPQIAAAVQLGGLIQGHGEGHVELAEQEDAHGRGQGGQDQHQVGVQDAQGTDGQVVGDDGGFPGDHHGGHDQHEQQIFALE